MTKETRIEAFVKLGENLRNPSDTLEEVIFRAVAQNSWFTQENVKHAIQANAEQLQPANLEQWLAPYPFANSTDLTVGLVCAGNIPMVGFHDVLSVLISGFRLEIKFSSDDQVLMRYALDELCRIEPQFKERINEVQRLSKFDLVIATGSDNTARYFHHYFEKYPHIIRKNRHAVAVLNGSETATEFYELGKDIFTHFGLGCRNVSKIYVPEGFDIVQFYEGIEAHQSVFEHHKYRNNYDFNKSIYLINGDKHFDNGFLLLKPDERLGSPLAVLYYETYNDISELQQLLVDQADQIQCVVGKPQAWSELSQDFPSNIPFGEAQTPALTDYADGVDTLAFLAKHYH